MYRYRTFLRVMWMVSISLRMSCSNLNRSCTSSSGLSMAELAASMYFFMVKSRASCWLMPERAIRYIIALSRDDAAFASLRMSSRVNGRPMFFSRPMSPVSNFISGKGISNDL